MLCRNVLIYFTPELQARALQGFAFALRTGGYLALGNAETPRALANYFAAADPQLKLYIRSGRRAAVPVLGREGTADRTSGRALAGMPPGTASGTPPDTGREGSVSEQDTLPVPPVDLPLDVPWGVVVVDQRYDIQSINRAARRFLGIYRDAAGEDLIHLARIGAEGALRTAINAAFQEAVPTDLAQIVPAILATGEECLLQITCQPHERHPGGAVGSVMVLIRDVTAAERVLTRYREDATRMTEQLQGMAAANRELLTANALLNGTTVGLRRDMETAQVDTAEAQAHTEEVITLNEELQATNEEMETLNEEVQATVEEVQTANAELEARRADRLVAQVCGTARDLPPGHAVSFDQDMASLHVRGDANRLEQALLNLLTNAFNYAPSESPVVVRLRRVGDEVALSVQDYGPGIAADQLPHLFSRFYQVARPPYTATDGLGLGLFISREMIEAQGGRLTVSSREGGGSTFTIWLPLMTGDTNLSEPANEPAVPTE